MTDEDFRFNLWHAIRYGQWDIGWYTKKEWPTKNRFGFFTAYYDGMHAAIHLGPFCLSVYY